MEKVKVRINNSHKHIWAVVWNGQPEDFSDAKDITLIASVRDKRINLTQGIDYVIEGNLVKIDFTPRFCKNTGVYNIELNYTKPSESFLSGERRTAVDLNVIEIVGTSACADATDETSSVSEAAFGFQGLSAYEVWLKDNPGKTKEDYFAFLQKPATDAIASIQAVEQTVSENEGLRVSAESERDLAEGTRVQAENERLSAEIIRQSNEGDRIENEATRIQNEAERISKENVRQSSEIDRVEAESERVQAESERVQAESERQITIQEAITATNLANEKANLANIAAQSANEAAGLADTARTELTTAVNTKLGEADDKIEEMDTTLSTYDGRVTQVESDITQLAGDVNELGIKNAVQGAKIKDIENVLSTANLNQSAKISVSGHKNISLPKNASNGGMEVKLEGLTAENLFVDGKLITATSYAHNSGRKIDVILGNKYYARRLYQTISGTNSSATGRVVTLSPAHEFVSGNDILSRISTYNYESEYNKTIYIYGPQTGTTLGEFRDVMIINLTATFGAGNEPDLATCDAMFSDYFEGVKSFVPTGRIRSVGKNILDISSLKSSDFVNIGGGYWGTLIPVVPNVTYVAKAYDIANLGNPNFYIQWRSEDMAGPQTFASPNRFFSYSRVFPTDKMMFAISSPSPNNIDSRLEYIKKNIAIQIERSPTPTPYEPYKETSLYLTAPELRSNGLVKDEIRKGANGYELVKRVNDIVISGVENWIDFGQITLTDEVYRARIYNWGSTNNALAQNDAGIGKNDLHVFEYKIGGSYTTTSFAFYITGGHLYLAIDKAYLDTNYAGTIEGFKQYLQEHPIKLTYTLVEPEIIPISYGGVLNSAENGTVYHEPIIADAGVYSDKMDILLTDYPISSIEEIIKHENGIDMYLDVSTAVIASDGLSFTHPDLTDGDLVLFTYAYDKESTNGNITATFYDSNVVKIDTATGKAYKIEDVITNGVLTRTLTEV